MLVLGIMSGTSMDGVDYAACEVGRRTVRLVKLWQREFPTAMRQRIAAAAANGCSSHELAQLHHDLGRLYAHQAQKLRSGASLVGLHGQTVFHNPSRSAPATLQIGEPAYLAEALRVPVVSNFRAADIAAGGQGAPLATLFHQVAFARRGKHICVNNLGGISNVTSIDWTAERPRILAFDTGPANVLMDLACRELSGGKRSYDHGGEWASRGKVSEPLLSGWLKHPFFKAKPPKSTGREEFGEPFWASIREAVQKLTPRDVLATLTGFTAESIALNYKLHLSRAVDEVILCGGGAENPELRRRIALALETPKKRVKVSPVADHGWPSSAVEPAAFALLAYYRWKRIPANIPETTGAVRSALLGTISGI